MWLAAPISSITYTALPLLLIGYTLQKKEILAMIFLIMAIGVSIFVLLSHDLPKFYSITGLTSGFTAPPFSIISNTEKYLVALAWAPLLSWLRTPPSTTLKKTFSYFKHLLYMHFTVFPLGLVLGFVCWDPDVPQCTLLWFIHMCLVCVSEEICFRGVIQNLCIKTMPSYPNLMCVLASFFFGLAHYRGGLKYILLSTIAGWFYGYSTLRTGQLRHAIGAHLALNTVHFLLFSYPYALNTL